MKTIKNILPLNLTNDIKYNIKLIKRKLNIYNLQNESNYELKDFGIDIIYNKFKDKTSIFYFYKKLDEDFDYNLLYVYKENYFKASQFLKETLEECKIYERKKEPDSIFFFKKDKFVLEQDLKLKHFWLSYDLIWSKFESKFSYKWLEINNLCNSILEETFKQGGFTTYIRNNEQSINWKNKEDSQP